MSIDYWPPDFGGELLLTIERLQTIAQRGHSVVVLTRRPAGFDRAEQQGTITIRRSPVPGRGLFALGVYILWAVATLLRLSFDAMHVGNMAGVRAPIAAVAVWLLTFIGKLRGARTISVVSLAESETEAWQIRGRTGLFKRIYYDNMDHIVAVSPALFKPLDRWWPGKAVLITNGVRDDLFTALSSEERASARKEFAIPADSVVFITIGSAGKRKGYDLLAQAFAALGGRHPNWFLWLVGPMSQPEGCGTEERELIEMMAPLRHVEAQVRSFGRINDRNQLRRLLGASDVFVFPTRREGFGLAPVEAMAMAMPVIVARIPGVTDVACVHEETGLLVPVGDPKALAQSMERLGTDAKLRATLAAKAQTRVHEAFSWNMHITRWERLYSQGVC